ncbi:hypothetical protein [Kitasatospora purpeofusca]|uniref:Uncharacterized protein n=1 Tax=Kitasatospora purpeofusca TaxID=67352 RepID=A0ABZ1UBP1_9ACTN|nr:hypothetical protein [Kitasatospora purpeofusca]
MGHPLVLAEYRNYQQGIPPAGPGARSLTEFFASVDEKLEPAAASAPRTQSSDRDVLNLLTKRARTLHIGPANLRRFTDPSRALCLKLAGTPTADQPPVGMCDSARCPQATHHPCHRPIWAEHAERTKTFLGDLGRTRKTEHARLPHDYDRTLRVVAEIDTATLDQPDENSARGSPQPNGPRTRTASGPPWTVSCTARSRPAAPAASRPPPERTLSTAPPSTAPAPTPTCEKSSNAASKPCNRPERSPTHEKPRSHA